MKMIPRVTNISLVDFQRHFLTANRPVIVADGLVNSPATINWNLDYFKSRFGRLDVAISGHFFSPISVMRLSEFIDLAKQLEIAPPDYQNNWTPTPYLRLAHTAFGGVDFTSIFFDALQDEWQRPYFLPMRNYFFPLTLTARPPNRVRFPEWGLFISPRGGVTRIHIDQTNDNTILAATLGQKVGYLFEPTPSVLSFLAQEHLRNEAGSLRSVFERRARVFDGQTPDYPQMIPYYFKLNPGEVLFIPKRWAHEVFTTQACISFTYNFIHFTDVDYKYLMHRYFNKGYH